MLFHDVAERRADFGVWRLWSELTQRYPSFTFHHGHGLGVLGVGGALPAPVSEFLHLTAAEAGRIRRLFLRQGRLQQFRTTLEMLWRRPNQLARAILEGLQKPAPASGA